MIEKKVVNPKIYTFVKFLFTFYCFIVMIMQVIFLFYYKKDFITSYALIRLSYISAILSFILIILFIVFRFLLHKKTKYKYSKLDFKLNIIWITMLIFLYLQLIISIIVFYFTKKSSFEIFAYVNLSAILILSIAASMIEWRSRINEVIYLTKIWDNQTNVKDLDKENLKVLEKKFEEKEKTKSKTIVKTGKQIKKENPFKDK